MRYLRCALAPLWLVSIVAVVGHAEPLPMSEASPLQTATDPVMGDWQGEWGGSAPSGSPLYAQVIALGGGLYQANMLSKPNERGPALAVLNGKTTDDGVAFEGEKDGAQWSATIEGDAFKGALKGAESGVFELRKAPRDRSGVKPPAHAVVLFDGTNVEAWEHPVGNPYGLNLAQAVGGENRAAYLRARVSSPKAQAALLEIGSDDGVKVWLNGKVVHANNASRGVNPGEDKVAVNLVAEWNDLMLKVTQGAGDWGACVRLRTPDGGDLGGIRVGADPADPGKAADLEATKGFLMDWQLSGPYSEEGKDGKALFDVAFAPETGGDAEWKPMPKPAEAAKECHWKLLENGAVEVRGGGLISKRTFKDHQIHLEFRLPLMPDKRGQARANSGIYIQGRYEIQILDSYGLEGRDNECGGIYKVAAPRVNMCAPPLTWQTYDILFHAPRFDAAGDKTEDARLSVAHNGVLIHEDLALPAPTPGGVGGEVSEPGGLYIQDHGNPVWFHNIWVIAPE